MAHEKRHPELCPAESARRGSQCAVPEINNRAFFAILTKLEHSLAMNGAKIFNALPRDLINFAKSRETFKVRFDRFLKLTHVKPYLPHYQLRVPSNSLVSQT